MILANPCKNAPGGPSLDQLRDYYDAGFIIGNHTCSHPRLDDVGADAYIKDIEKGEELLKPFVSKKYFRYPFFNESIKLQTRDRVRSWLQAHGFKNTPVTIDSDDYVFAPKLNQAKKLGKHIDYGKVESLYIEHIIGAAEFYDSLSKKTLGRSPKHTVLIHEVDSSALFLEGLAKAFRQNGWKIISAEEAYGDPVYNEMPQSLTSGSGLITQITVDRTGKLESYNDGVARKLDSVLALPSAR